MFVDDFIDEFYAFNINSWADSLETILRMLNYPVQREYTCEWREYLYERLDRQRNFGTDDRKLLTECQEIVMFRMDGRFRKLKMVSVMFTGNPHYRNEKAYDIYKLFRKIYGRYVLFVACFDRDIAFVGTAVDKGKKREVIISDWFGESTDREIMSRILEIDFALFSYDNLEKLYGDYLWAISRPYVKFRESKLYLIFESGYIDTYETFAADPDSNEIIPVTKVDREETLRVNSSYYPELYGNDYFIDESEIEDDTLDILDEDDAEFEWTMLEMELAKEDADEEDDYDDDFKDVDEYNPESEDEYDEILGMNPEEMLKYIRGV